MRIVIAFIVLTLASCRSISDRNEECIESLPFEVRDHVTAFINEANKRGKVVKLRNLRIKMVSQAIYHKGHRAAAQTNTFENSILFDITSSSWRNAPRALVFHELGHAILKKDHSADKDDVLYTNGLSSDNRLTEECLDRLFN